MADSKRIQWLDIARGMGLFLVLIGHSSCLDAFFAKIIYSFHVPLFFVISGMFYNARDLKKALKRVLFLIYQYCFIIIGVLIVYSATTLLGSIFLHTTITLRDWAMTLVHLMINFVYASGNRDEIIWFGYKLPIGPIGAGWFIPALISTEVIMLIVCKIRDKYGEFIGCSAVLLFFLIGIITSRGSIWFPFSIQAGMVCSVFFYVGIVLRGDIIKECVTRPVASIFVVLVNWILLEFLLSMISDNSIVKPIYAGNIFRNVFGDILCGLCGCSIIFCLAYILSNKRIKIRRLSDFFEFLGKYCVVGYCFHSIEHASLRWDLIQNYLRIRGITCWIIVVVRVLVMIIWICFARSNKLLNKFFRINAK